MRRRRVSCAGFLLVQTVFAAAVGIAYAATPAAPDAAPPLPGFEASSTDVVAVDREQPLRVTSLYNEPEVVSDTELARVLQAIVPRFADETELSPNHVEHALRTWHVDAEFQDPRAMSGAEMRDFLLNHDKYRTFWDAGTEPLLQEAPRGIDVRYGRERGASVHHDHTLACLTEAGVPLHQPVTPASGRRRTLNDVLQQALFDFRLDERETEWSAMAFGLWLPPVHAWRNGAGRRISFDLMARRLMRGRKRFGVCSGTHRVYSLALLMRMDDEFGILSPSVRETVEKHLLRVRDLIVDAQFEDGHWPYNWQEGARAVEEPADEPRYRKVIATGHHLEWLAIVPERFHPPRAQLVRAARWCIRDVEERSAATIRDDYTYYSHVGSALALWRQTRAAKFWRSWRAEHPFEPGERPAVAERP